MPCLCGASEKNYDQALQSWERESKDLLLLRDSFWFEVLADLKRIMLNHHRKPWCFPRPSSSSTAGLPSPSPLPHCLPQCWCCTPPLSSPLLPPFPHPPGTALPTSQPVLPVSSCTHILAYLIYSHESPKMLLIITSYLIKHATTSLLE